MSGRDAIEGPKGRGYAGVMLAALVLGAVGCADNEVSLFIVQNEIPVPSTTGAACTVLADPVQPFRNTGIVDVSLRDNYVMYPLFRNELQSDQSSTSGRAETRGIYVEGIDVDLRIGESTVDNPDAATIAISDATGPIPTYYRVYAPTFVPPTLNGTPGYNATTAELIPSRIIAALRAQYCSPTGQSAACPRGVYPDWTLSMVATVKPFGRTMGGIYIQGANYIFPITFCCNCLVQFPAGANSQFIAGPDCTGEAPMTATVCDIGQDAPVDCRLCSGDPKCQPPGYSANYATFACPTQ